MKRLLALFACTAALSAAPLSSALAQVAVGGSIGTPGVGAVVEFQVNPLLSLRGAVDVMRFNHDEDYSDVNYDGKVKELTGGLFADFHPGGGALFVSGGAYFGERKLDLTARPTTNVNIGGVVYSPAAVGRIDGEAKLSKIQPFVGAGYDNTFTTDGPIGVRALVGVAFSKKPDVNLTSSGGLLSADPTFLARLRQEEADAQDDAKKFRYFPVVQLGVTHAF